MGFGGSECSFGRVKLWFLVGVRSFLVEMFMVFSNCLLVLFLIVE